MTTTYDIIQAVTLSVDSPFVDFTSILPNWTDLLLESDFSVATSDGICLRLNGDTGTNYSVSTVSGTPATTNTNRATNASFANIGWYAWPVIGKRAASRCRIMNYCGSTVGGRVILTRGDAPSNAAEITISLWRSTAVINAIRVMNTGAGNFKAGSTFVLKGIKAA